MMKRNKHLLRIGIFISIGMLLLIPMLNPVTADSTFDVSTANGEVQYPGGGNPPSPNVYWWGNNPQGNYTWKYDGGACILYVKCVFVFKDSNQTNNSRHYGELYVQQVLPLPVEPYQAKSTGNQYPGSAPGGEIEVDLVISDTYTAPTKDNPVRYHIWVYAECELLISPFTIDYETWEWYYTIYV
jgi:hypothetical protein